MEMLKIFKGALSFEIDKEGFITPCRFTKKQLKIYEAKPNRLYAKANAGILMEFYTDCEEISFSYKMNYAWTNMFEDSTPTFDIFENDTLTLSKELCISDLGNTHSVKYHCESAKTKKITIVFPSNAILSVGDFSLGNYKPAQTSDGTFLVLGDSVSQGLLNNSASNNYPFLLKRFLNFDYINQGVGGDSFASNALDDIGYTPDFSIIALGTNDMVFTNNLEKTKVHIHTFFDAYSKLYKNVKTFVITPIWLTDSKENPERFKLLADISKEIEKTAKSYGYVYIDGQALIPHDKRYYSDEAHPNDLGFSHYALNLVKFIQ